QKTDKGRRAATCMRISCFFSMRLTRIAGAGFPSTRRDPAVPAIPASGGGKDVHARGKPAHDEPSGSSLHREIEIGTPERLVAEREVPPFLDIAHEAVTPHRIGEQRAVLAGVRADRRVARPRAWTEGVERRAHVELDRLAAVDQPHERDVDGRAARMAGL